MVDRESII